MRPGGKGQREKAMLKIAAMMALLFASAMAPAPETLTTQAAPAAPVARGWIKTFAVEPLTATGTRAPFETPDYLGSLTEGRARAAMREALIAQGYNEAAPPAPKASSRCRSRSMSPNRRDAKGCRNRRSGLKASITIRPTTSGIRKCARISRSPRETPPLPRRR